MLQTQDQITAALRTETLYRAHQAFLHEEDNTAEFYNLGWAQGEDFIHSKTSIGRLFSYYDNDTVKHLWTK